MIKNITISIVSHNQIDYVKKLLSDLKKFNFYEKIIITTNIKENLDSLENFKNLQLKIIANDKPKGFGENHNFAFNFCNTKYFLILNPDVRINKLDINNLQSIFNNEKFVYVVSPTANDLKGAVQDNARVFPKLYDPFLRIFKKNIDYKRQGNYLEVDWVSGMFMLFDAKKFSELGGFDENFFLYYEDVDICKRIKLIGGKTIISNIEKVIHTGQKASHTNIKYSLIHIKSLFRYHFKNYSN